MKGKAEIAARALHELDVEIAARRSELHALVRARAVVARDHAADRCDAHEPSDACTGPIWARWCRACGLVTRRCASHGALAEAARVHAAHECGGSASKLDTSEQEETTDP